MLSFKLREGSEHGEHKFPRGRIGVDVLPGADKGNALVGKESMIFSKSRVERPGRLMANAISRLIFTIALMWQAPRLRLKQATMEKRLHNAYVMRSVLKTKNFYIAVGLFPRQKVDSPKVGQGSPSRGMPGWAMADHSIR